MLSVCVGLGGLGSLGGKSLGVTVGTGAGDGAGAGAGAGTLVVEALLSLRAAVTSCCERSVVIGAVVALGTEVLVAGAVMARVGFLTGEDVGTNWGNG